jgi:hypothetical protein
MKITKHGIIELPRTGGLGVELNDGAVRKLSASAAARA